jgi:hypothetical protein
MMRKFMVPICLLLLTFSFPSNGISPNVSFETPEYDFIFGASWDGSAGDIENVLLTSTYVNSLLANIYTGASDLTLKRVGLQTWTGSAVKTNLLAEVAGYASRNAVGWYDTNSTD